MRLNELGQAIGDALPHWQAPPHLARATMRGRYCRVEPLNAAQHAADLFAANALDAAGAGWTYLGSGPFTDFAVFHAWIEQASLREDAMFHAIVDLRTQKAVGSACYSHIDPANGVVEIGSLKFSPLMQRTPVSTESMYLMMKNAFDLGYRRYEWKCDSLNAPSRRAAQRFGLSYEGTFRQLVVIKGRTRDTAWFSIIDSEWPAVNDAFTRWLAPQNFDAQGNQRVPLSSLTGPLLKARG